MSYRSGFIAIVGRPNVGKSTALNGILGQKVAITSPRVQTTRTRIRGILTLEKARGQIVFLDTPGFSKPLDTLGEILTDEAHQALQDADGFLFVVDGSAPVGSGDSWLAEQLIATGKYTLLLINKIDAVKNAEIRNTIRDGYCNLFKDYKDWDFLTVSAHTGKRLSVIPKLLLRHLPTGQPLYDEETVTDQTVRTIAQEMIREKAMILTQDELPHSVAVLIDTFNETDPACTRIAATLYVDQTSQKGMVIGKNGQMIKNIGSQARKEIEQLLEGQVYLELNVKVKANWRKDPAFLKQLGLQPQ